MGTHTIRLYHDRIGQGETVTYEGAVNRILYCRWGGIAISGHPAELVCDGAALCTDATSVTGSIDGAIVWRFELIPEEMEIRGPAHGALSSEKVAEAEMTLEIPHGYLIRCDAVNFPLGCEIYKHTHAGGGIRCIHRGELSLDFGGEQITFGPDDAWFEPGPEPVCGTASTKKGTGFVRVMILPRTLLGKSSISYLDEADWSKPKRQTYKTYVDSFIEV